MSTTKTNIDLYTAGTPNGQKVSCLLEELGLNYTVHKIDISKNVQKEEWFLKINPNGRIPALIDNTPSPAQRVFEGGSILLYLTTRYDKDHTLSFPHDSADYWECLSWLTWLQSGIGPMQGQANHFYRYAPQKIEYAIGRYQTETKRLYGVLEARLAEQSESQSEEVAEEGKGGVWLVGGKFSIADLACFSWVNWAEWAGVSTEPFPRLKAWLDVINKRPAIQKGCDVPDRFEMKEAMKTKEGEEEYAKHHSNWVMKGQEADQEKHK